MDEELEHIQREALDLARLWARYVQENNNSVWSEQQASFINAFFENLDQSLLTKEIYLKAQKKLANFRKEK